MLLIRGGGERRNRVWGTGKGMLCRTLETRQMRIAISHVRHSVLPLTYVGSAFATFLNDLDQRLTPFLLPKPPPPRGLRCC
jgi:hypothetical protein